ncbi:MAG: ATP-binding cassette domain-containing protein [Gemmatimonadales bacterium]|nr:ATP-binding cassette domain-containing protein [Gemmatimonadales bacterium]
MEVRIRDLQAVRGGRSVLEVPDLTFPSGTTTAIFGPNGSGKTTLLRCLAGLERPVRGTIELGDAGSSARRHQIAYAFQSAVFISGTVRRNLELGLELRRVPLTERAGRLAAAARECGIAHLLDRPARQLSGGEAQRVNVARALALGAPLTLLDEPLAGVDRATREQLLDDLPGLLERFAATAIVVTHDRDEALRLAEHLVVIADGRVLAAGPKRALFTGPPDAATAALLGYTLIEDAGKVYALRSGALTPDPSGGKENGGATFRLKVRRTVDLGDGFHALGEINGQRVDVLLPPGARLPEPGSELPVTARAPGPIIFAGRPTEPEQR